MCVTMWTWCSGWTSSPSCWKYITPWSLSQWCDKRPATVAVIRTVPLQGSTWAQNLPLLPDATAEVEFFHARAVSHCHRAPSHQTPELEPVPPSLWSVSEWDGAAHCCVATLSDERHPLCVFFSSLHSRCCVLHVKCLGMFWENSE